MQVTELYQFDSGLLYTIVNKKHCSVASIDTHRGFSRG